MALTLEQIRSRATANSFQRGQSYYNSGSIVDAVRRGNELTGSCEGSQYEPYRIRVTLTDDGDVLDASCTCPYDWGGDCKHIVALLLTFHHAPDTFAARPPVDAALAARSKDDLIALIHQMIARYPDLQALVDRPQPAQQPRQTPINTESFQRELRHALRREPEWGDRTLVHTVSSIATTGQQFADAGDWRNAYAVYFTILDECLAGEDYPADDEGELAWALNGVLEQLVACLEQDDIANDDTQRRAILDRLVTAYLWELRMGGYGLGEDILPDALLNHTRRDDLPPIRKRVQALQQQYVRQRQAGMYFGQWIAEALERFLMQLDALDETDPEVTLQRLRDQGMHRLVFERLLGMGRTDEAVALLADDLTEPHERVTAFNLLAAAGHTDTAIRLARASLDAAGYEYRLGAWLDQQYQERGDREALFALRRQAMDHAPSEQHYRELKEAAQAVGTWDQLRPDILSKLERDRRYDELTRIYLQDEEWAAAWDAAEKAASGNRWGGARLLLEVALKTLDTHPDKAIPVLIRHARASIDARQRKHYAQAAAYLLRVREAYRKQGQDSTWQTLITGIRTEFRNLPALQDELHKAGLT
ncbi:MAG: SWIM zinc finger family protein [Anaerolineae bacterium]|nr:SWIM zinc finger family protein [Anaerolineae bacterium]